MTTLLIIGVDPGAVSGGAAYRTATHKLETATGRFTEVCSWVRSHLDSTKNDETVRTLLAVERYNQLPGRRAMTAQNDALEVIGVLRWFSSLYSVVLLEQGASDAARVGNRETLSSLGWWHVSDPDQHRNRAAAQVALAYARVDSNAFERLLSLDGNSSHVVQ